MDFESAKLRLREDAEAEEEEEEEGEAHRVWKLNHSVWEKRFRVIFCFAGGDESHRIAYGEVAEICAHLFSDTNLVLSDIAAGLVLLQKEHLHRELTLLNTPDAERSSRSVALNFCNPSECKLFEESFHFVHFALGIYSWPLHVYMNMCCGICGLLHHMTFPCRQHTRIAQDNRCSCGYAGIVAASKINGVDILYATLENDLYQAPFMVCLDHASRSVVVSVRGSLSLHDALTDLTAAAHHIKLPGWPRFRVHKGMYQTASWILEKITDEDVLAQAFRRVPQYDLVFVGHSLGAGCACLLSIILKEQYPNLRCFCYSPTGSLLSAECAAYTQTFVTSVTLGQDLVTRLSVPSAHTLKEDVIRALEACRKPKYRILLEGGMETLSKCCGKAVVFHEEESTSADVEAGVSDTETCDQVPLLPAVTAVNQPVQCEEEDMEVPNAAMPPLFPPGRIIHIVDTLAGAGRRQLEARWASSNSFSRVVVSPEMIHDHLPNVLLRAMEAVWQQKKGSTLPHPV